MKIEEIDKNFASASFEGLDIEWFNIRKAPFKIYGLLDDGEQFFRMPIEIAEKVSEGVTGLNKCTSGGRVRFATDSSFVAIAVEQPDFWIGPHITALSSGGFDLYCDDGRNKGFFGSFQPDCNIKKTRNVVRFAGRDWDEGVHNFTINFPLYAGVNDVYVGIKKGSTLSEGKAYEDKLPIVYYGSSITQGGCASRPGTCYQNLICTQNNTDYIHLGFSGNAKGEDVMAEYIASLPMSVFVYDYDHNAPDADHLKKTHERFLRIIKDKHPNVPVIMLSKPTLNINDYQDSQRRQVIIDTYNKLKAEGDNNVYFIDGYEMLKGEFENECLVDYCHPTDLGFSRMASAIFKILNLII